MSEEEIDDDYYDCACGVHCQIGALYFFAFALCLAVVNIVRGIYYQDDFHTIGSLIDCGSLMFGAAVLAVLRFHELYERSSRRRRILLPGHTSRENLAPEILFYVLIVLVHAVALNVVWQSYKYMGVAASQKKTNVNALRVLIEAERQRMLAIRNQRPSEVEQIPHYNFTPHEDPQLIAMELLSVPNLKTSRKLESEEQTPVEINVPPLIFNIDKKSCCICIQTCSRVLLFIALCVSIGTLFNLPPDDNRNVKKIVISFHSFIILLTIIGNITKRRSLYFPFLIFEAIFIVVLGITTVFLFYFLIQHSNSLIFEQNQRVLMSFVYNSILLILHIILYSFVSGSYRHLSELESRKQARKLPSLLFMPQGLKIIV
ncbi:hypothetical protein M3Y98_01053300 [Aphelenchoides besseyi]|nr:hypothetical protein M3Y98_01053300 [Aphelenchoides besseyi]KAI6209776.1 hypothetical protein M3Y96_00256500 [Aphelenchoides besseyi]